MNNLATRANDNVALPMKPQVSDKSGFQTVEVKTKHCPRCGRDLPVSAFPKHGKTKDGYANECRECKRRRTDASVSKGNTLAKFTARELMHELSERGYKGDITFTEVIVHKMNLKDF